LCNTTPNQSIATEGPTTTKTLKALAESNRWYILRDRAREVFTHDIQSIAAKISADIDIDHCRINPKADLNFSTRTVSRQALLNLISSYNRIWFRLAMEVLFPINIENYQQMKLSIEQYLIQSTGNTSSPSNDMNFKKTNLNNTKIASAQIRLTIKNLILIIIFLERAKLLRLIDHDPCLYTRESKFKSTKESIDVLSRDFISSDTNLIRRLKLAGFEPIYRQTSLDEYNYLITNNENKLFEDLKDGIRLTRCAQILLSSTNEQVARFDLSTKLKCPVVNLVHKLLNIDQAFELLQTYGHVNLNGM
jgi:abnormal spindle-like microcephaly-associated protein